MRRSPSLGRWRTDDDRGSALSRRDEDDGYREPGSTPVRSVLVEEQRIADGERRRPVDVEPARRPRRRRRA